MYIHQRHIRLVGRNRHKKTAIRRKLTRRFVHAMMDVPRKGRGAVTTAGG
nr:MAG TPA: hypothetical protein [Caudoviricetes sp.]